MASFRILLVDDEEIFAKNMSKLLSYRGYKVGYVTNGYGAILEIDKSDFDVVILDLRMPGIDGLATLKGILNRNSQTKVMILTGDGFVDDALDAIKLGAYDYLLKPVEIDELTEKIENACK